MGDQDFAAHFQSLRTQHPDVVDHHHGDRRDDLIVWAVMAVVLSVAFLTLGGLIYATLSNQP